ncbi:MAG: hypothetical protein Kow0063_37390 [Anaerolineae bacterium]
MLAGLISTRPGLKVNVYTALGDEARRWHRGIEASGGISLIRGDEVLVGCPQRVSDDPAAVIPGSQLVLLSLPAFAHEIILRKIAPYLEDGVWLGALPARGAFDWCAREVLGDKRDTVILFGLQTLPWACRIREFGQEVVVLGTKTEVDLAAWPSRHAEQVAISLSDLVGVPMCPISCFLSLTLAGTGQLIHPGIMYGLFHDWDGHPYAEAPLFYHGIDSETAEILERLSGEVQSLRALLEERFPDLDLSAVLSLYDWLRRAYGDRIGDCSSLRNCFVSNEGYAGLRAPMRRVGDGWLPDFQTRYLTEDVPYALIATRGIAELAGLSTPMMDQVISWSQERLRQQYLVDGELRGCDLASSRAPQRFGFTSLSQVVRDALAV